MIAPKPMVLWCIMFRNSGYCTYVATIYNIYIYIYVHVDCLRPLRSVQFLHHPGILIFRWIFAVRSQTCRLGSAHSWLGLDWGSSAADCWPMCFLCEFYHTNSIQMRCHQVSLSFSFVSVVVGLWEQNFFWIVCQAESSCYFRLFTFYCADVSC